jgi:AcrR family transcriptional regulator
MTMETTTDAPSARPRELLAGLSPVGRTILDAARALVSARGLDALSLRAVAAAAGVHKSAIAYHFGNKDGLVIALAELLFEEYPQEAALRPAPSSDPAERVARRFGVLRRLAKDREYWSLAYALWSHTQVDESFSARAEELKLDGLRRTATALGMDAHDPADLALVNALDAAVAGLALDSTFGWDVTLTDAALDALEAVFTPALLAAMKDAEGA